MNAQFLALLAAAAKKVFANPAAVTAGFESGTPVTVTSNTVTVTLGQRVVLLFSQQRGSAATPSVNRTVSGIAGTGDLTGAAFITHEGLVQRDDADEGGVGVYIASWVADTAGTGAFTVTWSGSVWATMAEAHVLASCSLIDSAILGANDAATAVAPVLAGVPLADDLVFSIANQSAGDAYNVPTDFTGGADLTSGSNNRARTAWRNGGAAQTTTWSGMSGASPLVAAVAQFRRT